MDQLVAAITIHIQLEEFQFDRETLIYICIYLYIFAMQAGKKSCDLCRGDYAYASVLYFCSVEIIINHCGNP